MLDVSRGVRELTDLETIRSLLPGCVEVIKTNGQQDRAGIDYLATLRGGAVVAIDAKTRQSGCSRYWADGIPDLALEKWSVIPSNGYDGKTGWTLSETSNVDYILFTFDKSDSNEVFLYPFQLLRAAFRAEIHNWYRIYRHRIQNSGTWQSECVFVPEHVVWKAVRYVMHDTAVDVTPPMLFSDEPNMTQDTGYSSDYA